MLGARPAGCEHLRRMFRASAEAAPAAQSPRRRIRAANGLAESRNVDRGPGEARVARAKVGPRDGRHGYAAIEDAADGRRAKAASAGGQDAADGSCTEADTGHSLHGRAPRRGET